MFESYRVENNENLRSVAEKFNTTIKVLQDLNDIFYIDEDLNGREIIVPENTQDYYNYYVVKKGDNLYAIAKKFNINPELLASLNGINTDDYIYPNNQLLIPKKGYSYYITAEGDTIEEVIKAFNSNINKFLKENKTIYLMEGQLLVNKK